MSTDKLTWDVIQRQIDEVGWSLTELARRIAYEERTLKRVRSGEVQLSAKLVKAVAQAIEISKNGTPRGKLAATLQDHGISPAQLAKKIGYDAGVISNVVNGNGRASESMIEAIVRELPELSKDDLMDGGSELPAAEGSASGLYGQKPTISLPPGMTGRMVPLLSLAQAGAWDAGHTDEGWTGAAVFALNVDDRKAFAIKVSGNSMEPDICEGDIVICSPRVQLTPGCCAVIRTRSESALIKFWRKKGDLVILESANPDYPPIRFPASEIAGAWPVVQRITSGMIKRSV